MEKKQYINPEIEVVKIATQQMLAASLGVGTDPTDPASSDAPFFEGDDF